MEDSQGGSFVPGPLDDLLPGLRALKERLPALVAHPRVSRVRGDDGRDIILFASFATVDQPRALHKAFQPIVETALLSALSQQGPARSDRVHALELYTFAPFPFEPDRALSLFGFTQQPSQADSRRALSLLRREAQLLEDPVTDEPTARFVARVVDRASHLAQKAAERLHAEAPHTPWGTEPGALARLLAGILQALGFSGVEPTRAGIERLESLLLQETPGVIRWIDPLCFQALCDLIAVAAHNTWRASVEWAVCDPDPDTGLASPPLVRVYKPRDRSSGHVPLGEHILRWAVMPRRADETIPTLGAWAEHEFT